MLTGDDQRTCFKLENIANVRFITSLVENESLQRGHRYRTTIVGTSEIMNQVLCSAG